jgi:esterase/lipase
MKNISLIIVLLISALASNTLAQESLEVRSGTESFSVGTKDALIIEIYEADAKLTQKAWKKFLKSYDGKVKAKSEIFADDLLIKSMSSNTFDVYSKIVEKGDKIELICGVDLGGAFLSRSSHADQYEVFARLLKKFAVDVSKEAVKEQIKEQEKIFSSMQKEKEKLISDKERMEKEIEDYKQKISDNESAIEQNIKDQEQKTKDIATQQEVVTGLSEKMNAIK